MGNEHSGASPQIQIIWGQLEDRLRRFGERNPDAPHVSYEHDGEEALRLLGVLAERVAFELADYREHKQTGE